MIKDKEIKDDELRVIGRSAIQISDSKTHKYRWIIIGIVAVVFLLAFIITKIVIDPDADEASVVYDQSVVENINTTREPATPLGDYTDTTGKAYTEFLQRIINDITLNIYIPHNATPVLSLGTPNMHDKDIIFATQAADIRADNGKITGAFVLAGKPLAWGLSKKGYVGIIDGKITIGVAENSPLFEEATEKGGYFFRQYPLVDKGILVENESKGKAVRKAICERAGEIIIVMTETSESMHDFAQALVDLQVNNAVYLVGAYSYGFYKDIEGQCSTFCVKKIGGYRNENYILWKN